MRFFLSFCADWCIMTPQKNKFDKKARCIMTQFCSMTLETPVGAITLTADGEYIISLGYGAYARAGAQAEHRHTLLTEAARQLEEYFAGVRRDFDLPLRPSGTEFQLRVWEALRKIPYGAVASYSDVAKMIGSPRAARAVGNANNKNPIAIIIPCHRVIHADGSLGGYGGVEGVKEFLLDHEARVFRGGR